VSAQAVPATLPCSLHKRGEPVFAYVSLVALVVALQFSPVIGLIGFNLFGGAGWSLVGIARDGLVLLLASGVILQSLVVQSSGRWTRTRFWALAVVVSLLALAATSPAELAPIALNLRRLLLFPLLVLAVMSSRLSPLQVSKLLRLVLVTVVMVATLGVIEYLAPNALWSDVLRVVDYFSSNPLDPFGALPFEETGRFFTWDLDNWVGGPVRRAVSTYLEPTTLAAALMCGIGLALAMRRRGEPPVSLSLILILACGVLTLSKALALFVIVVTLYLRLGIPSPRRIFSLTIAGIAIALAAQAAGLSEGKFAHIAGLATSVQYLFEGNLLGAGLGNAGNYASEGADLDIGAESGLGNLFAQVGVVALIYIAWIQALATDLLKRARERHDLGGRYVAAIILGWFVSFLFSASSLGVGGNALTFMVAGLYLHAHARALRPAAPRP
jgi:hypothetical protein